MAPDEGAETLLDAFVACKRVQESLAETSRALHECTEDILPRFAQKIAAFPEAEARALARLDEAETVERHLDVLLELLELPRVMQALVAGQRYEEALDVHSQVQRLLAQQTHLPILRVVAAQIQSATVPMVHDLLQALGGSNKLSTCLRIVGYLRRLDTFSETELRLLLLQERGRAFQQRIARLGGASGAGVDARSAIEYLQQYMDCARAELFDTVTQYHAVFQDAAVNSDGDLALERGGLLASYVSQFVRSLVAQLRERLPSVTDMAVLASFYTTCMYMGQSLGRLGVDMRDLMLPCFEQQALRVFVQAVRPAAEHASREIEAAAAANRSDPAASLVAVTADGDAIDELRAQLRESTALEESGGNGEGDGEKPTVQAVAAPAALLNSPPLARVCNAFFGAFNQLRGFALMSLYEPVAAAAAESLGNVLDAVLAVPSATPRAQILALLAAEHLVPALVDGLEQRVYGEAGGTRLADAVRARAAKLVARGRPNPEPEPNPSASPKAAAVIPASP